MNTQQSPALGQVFLGWTGALLFRLFVPAWIFAGALSKAMVATPKLLPRTILDAGSAIGFDNHFVLLAILTAIEFAFVGVMLFIPKLARATAVTILCIFLIVLSFEIYNGAESCGCFGNYTLDPKLMFGIDSALLLGIIFIKPRVSKCMMNRGKRGVIGASIFIVLAWIFTFNSILYARNNTPAKCPTCPDSWYAQDVSKWIGQSVDNVELFGWVKTWPHDIHEGKQYVIFYGKSCDHCEQLLYTHFEFDVRFPTTLVAIPDSKDGFNEDGAFENPCIDCHMAELYIGTDWIISTPLIIAIENGIIKCATESEDYEAPACLIW